MRIKTLLLGCSMLLTFSGSAAQDNVAAKVENKTAVTPVENIKLNGVSMPLNIKTLAEIQRLQEEQAMREELTAALRAGGSIAPTGSSTGKPQAAPIAAASSNNPPVVKAKVKASAPASPNTLLGVYGTAETMTAEIQTSARTVRTLRVGERLGKFNIKRISNDGLELVASNGNTQYVSVGAQVRF